MARKRGELTWAARMALGFGSQRELAAALGYSRRTGQRWVSQGGPDSMVMAKLARLVFPRDAGLAAEIAESIGTTLDKLGIVAPAPPVPPPAPRVVLPERTVDAVVCAAAEAMQVIPQAARPAVLAAFACAKELDLTVDDVTRALGRDARPA